MQNLLIEYHMRLGDIVRCLPMARHFNAQGWSVWIECLPQYHGIFNAVSYVKPCAPLCHPVKMDRRIDLQIWPDRYADFRRSGKPWMDYVYGLEPEFSAIDRKIIFDRIDAAPNPQLHYLLPASYFLLCPFGYSQSRAVPFPALLAAANHLRGANPLFLFCDGAQRIDLLMAGCVASQILVADSLGHLPLLLREAAGVLTINSAPSIIASAVRKIYHHVPELCLQDDWSSPAQIRVAI